MVLVFIERTDPLAVDNKTLKRFICFAINELNRLVPYPEAFSAGIYRGTNAKTSVFLLFEQDSVKKK